MQKDQAVLAGAAAAASHQRQVRGSVGSFDPVGQRKAVFGEGIGDAPSSDTEARPLKIEVGAKKALIDVDGANDSAVNEGEQLEEVFGAVKAELAAGRGGATKTAAVPSMTNDGSPSEIQASSAQTRAKAVQVRVEAFGKDHINGYQDRITGFEAKAKSIAQRLSFQLRTARNLAVLTPFQKSTRDRIAASIPPLAERIREDRLQLVSLQMYSAILRQDDDREQQEWARLRHVALQAAAKSLRDPKGVKAVVQDVNANTEPPIPILSIISPGDTAEGDPLYGSSAGELPVMIRRFSAEMVDRPMISRHVSANGYASVSTSARPPLRRSASDFLSRRLSGSPLLTVQRDGEDSTGGRSTPIIFALSDVNEEVGSAESTIRAQTAQSDSTVEKWEKEGVHGEEAEDWQNTRAARRVSLANVPHGHLGELTRRIMGKFRSSDDGGNEGENAGAPGEEMAAINT